MLKPKSIRSVVQQRTLENMALDFQRFQGSGGNIKKAKDFNNVINTPIFQVPISQVLKRYVYINKVTVSAYYFFKVSPPGLHISLGIFQRLFTLLEDSCHELDMKLSESTTTPTDSTTSFDDLIQARKDMKNLVSEYSQLEPLIQQHQQLLTYLLLTQQNPQQSTVIQQIAVSINSNSKRLDEIVGNNLKTYI